MFIPLDKTLTHITAHTNDEYASLNLSEMPIMCALHSPIRQKEQKEGGSNITNFFNITAVNLLKKQSGHIVIKSTIMDKNNFDLTR